MRRGAIEMEKIVAWAIGAILAIVLMLFIRSQFGAEGGGLMTSIIDWFKNPFG